MFSPATFGVALVMTILSAVFWGSWANPFKWTRKYPFELFYWDYILGVVLCALVLALTLGSMGSSGEPFLANLQAADGSNMVSALIGGFIFNAANLLLVAGIAIAGLSIAFPIAIGIAVVEGVVLSYALQPKGNPWILAAGVGLAIAAILCDAFAYRQLGAAGRTISRKGIVINIVSGLLMGGFAPFVTRSLTHGHALTPYSVSFLFAIGAFLCCFVVNVYFMKHPLMGDPVAFGGYWKAGAREHVLGVLSGVIWGLGGGFNFIAAGFVGVAISYAIGQSSPMIAALWGVLLFKEFKGASGKAWAFLVLMFLFYLSAVSAIALAYQG